MCRNVIVCLLFLFLASSSTPAAISQDRSKDLPEKHRRWLEEEVTYIISKVERQTFLSLETEEEREAFIEAFWRRRDTSPTTLANEFQEEHYARLAYVNEFFGRDTFRPGWMTDRGRYYIILGPPTDRQDFSHEDAVYPTKLWFYNNPDLKRFGLPPFFRSPWFRRARALQSGSGRPTRALDRIPIQEQ